MENNVLGNKSIHVYRWLKRNRKYLDTVDSFY